MKESNHLKNVELSKLANIPNSTLADILKGKTERISVKNLKSLADVLGCSVDYLLDDQQKEMIPKTERVDEVTLDPEETELLLLYRRQDERGKDLLINVAKQQLGYGEESEKEIPMRVVENDWERYVGTMTVARGGIKEVSEQDARELAMIKRAFLEE